MAFRPTAPSGHFQRHIDTIVNPGEVLGNTYTILVPGYDKYEMGRTVLKIPVLPPHEVLQEEIECDPNLEEALRSSVKRKEWPPVYTEHPVVLGGDGDTPIWPIVLYIDGVPFQKRDGLLAFYVFNAVSEVRHLVAVLRKSSICRCGCCGWCSIWPILRWLSWSFSALAKGRMPSGRHDFAAWRADDRDRAQRANDTIAKGAVIHVKGDWSEFVHTLGVYPWSSASAPCFCCQATPPDLRVLGSFSPVHTPFPERTPEEYLEACERCEVLVLIPDVRTHQQLLGLLFYDKRKGKLGSRGRSLSVAFPALNLAKGDRLEPSDYLQDVGQFENLTPPVQVLFWRPGKQTFTYHRNPLFAADTGLSVKSLALDTLHCLYLGVYKHYCMTVMWELILADVWATGASTQDQNIQDSVLRLRQERRKIHPRRR